MPGLEGLLGGLNSTFVFVVVLSILIVVHEWGHFITAKLCGVRVLEFALGFGPTLWAKESNGTNYMLKAFPLGGYVRMAGDERENCSGAEDEFYSKSVGKRALIVLNGPVINFVLAYISFILVFMVGYPGLSTELTEIEPKKAAYQAGLRVGDEIVAIDDKKLYGWMHYERMMEGESDAPIKITARRDGKEFTRVLKPVIGEKPDLLGLDVNYRDIGVGFLPNIIGSVGEGYPAEEVGLKFKDVIVAIDGKAISNWTLLQEAVSTSKGETIAILALRDGEQKVFQIKPIIDTYKDDNGVEQQVRKIGVGPMQEFGSFKFNIIESFSYAWEELVYITVLTYKALWKMVTGSMSARKSVTGPVGIFYIVSGAAEEGFAHLTFILGVISASLAIFNLLPIIPLDGGHLFLLTIEKIKGGALPEKVEEFFGRFGLTLIIMLALYVFYSDFARFGIFEGIGNLFNKLISLFK